MISEAELKKIEEDLKNGWHMKGRTKIYIPASSCDIAGRLLTELRACREALQVVWKYRGYCFAESSIVDEILEAVRKALGEEK